MDNSMYSAMFGAMCNEMRMDTIANNLANVNTTAYKKDQVAFHDTFQRFAHDNLLDSKTYLRDRELWPRADVIARPRLSDQAADFSQGSLQVTGNPLDLALTGKGFFKVRTPDGDYLTRSGSFQLGSDGRLLTEQGFEVLGGGGPVILPQGNTVQIDVSGQIRVGDDVVGALDLTDVSDYKALEKKGNNLYGIRDGSGATEQPPEDLSVEQGSLEKSNVEVVTEMVAMIETQRSFEMYTKVMQESRDADTKLATQVANVNA
ncbi:MAG: flagellar basal-body rod protein FlgF [Desulfovibrionaceae bacterium]